MKMGEKNVFFVKKVLKLGDLTVFRMVPKI